MLIRSGFVEVAKNAYNLRPNQSNGSKYFYSDPDGTDLSEMCQLGIELRCGKPLPTAK